MRSGRLSLVSLLRSFLLLAAFARSESGGPGCLQAPCDAHAVDERGGQCATAGAAAATMTDAGRTSTMVLLQRQVASEQTWPTELQLVSEHDRADGQQQTTELAVAVLLPHAASAESTDSLPPVSLMTLASESRPARPVKRVKTAMLSTEEDSGSKGKTAPLNEMGYKAVARLKSQREMESFVKRVITDRGLHIVDEGSLKGLVPYHSGTKATQSFKVLVKEISSAAKNKKLVKGKMISWVTGHPKGEERDSDEGSELEPSIRVSEVGKKQTRKSGAFVQTWTATSETRPGKRRHHHTDSLVQTEASSGSSWILSLFGLLQGQAIFWLGARVTLVACAGSLLFGLFLCDESNHEARAAVLLGDGSPEDGLPRRPPISLGKDAPLTDKRPGAEALRQADPWRGLPDNLRPEASRPLVATAASTARASSVKTLAMALQPLGEHPEGAATRAVFTKDTAAARLQTLQSEEKEASPVFEAWRAKAAASLAAAAAAEAAADCPVAETAAADCLVAEEISGSAAAAPETAKEIQEPGAEPLPDIVSASSTEGATVGACTSEEEEDEEDEAGEAPQATAAKAASAEALPGAVEASESNVVAHGV